MLEINLWLLKFIRKIVIRLPLPNKIKLLYNNFYHSYIYSNLSKYFEKAMKFINNTNTTNATKSSNIIWLFWWQGTKNMPELIKECIKSIKLHSQGHKVIFLDKNNVKSYVKLPNYIYKKLDLKQIDLTHFSDILRANLLDNYGGLWIDSTVFCNSDISNKCFTDSIYTLNAHISNDTRQFISTKWCSFLLGCHKHSEMFQFLDNFEQIYWKYNNKLMVYFLLDYALDYAYQNNLSGFKYYVNNVAIHNNLHTNGLINIINDKYNENKYKKISKNTTFFKLTYKENFNKNKDSFYSYLINGKL